MGALAGERVWHKISFASPFLGIVVPMDALAAAAFAEAGRSPPSPPPPLARALLHAVPDPEGGPYTVSRLRAAAAEAGVALFREGRTPRGEPRRFYVAEPVAEALRPWTGPEARAAEEGWWSRRTASDVLLAAAASAEVRGRGRAVALPDPTKDPEGYAAARARLVAMAPADRAETALETRRAARRLPEGRAGGLRRAIEVLGRVPVRAPRPQQRPEGR